MFKKLLLLLFLVSLSFASEVDLSSPSRAVQSYYDAMNEGDTDALSQIMTEASFDTDMQVYALSIAFQDSNFHIILKEYEKSEEAKQIVIKAVKKKLAKRKKRHIVINKEISLGERRVMVRFQEDSKEKQLYLSHEKKGWKINYLAGRKTD